jgi:hypothetical protein
VLPLRDETAKALAAFTEKRLPMRPVFATPKSWRAAECLSADLAAAKIEETDASGRVVDFHALRTTFGTSLARGGVSLQVAQRLMRHCTPTLTANVYTVLGRDDERAAVAKLSRPTKPTANEQRATGTDDAKARIVWQANWQEGARKQAIPCDAVRRSSDIETTSERRRETLEISGFRGETAAPPQHAGADGYLVGPPVFKTGVPGDPR